ncbi:MAG: ABC transporter ATP-binding protein [Elusimicrobia bacterium RIFCSPHIGHO2_02_FULL_57_9]|nr:MAG: ABC transporter ATP-binding protein [Elusimicrobia bacterium RIFCSPHIGHO2_02_FULL_57_9]
MASLVEISRLVKDFGAYRAIDDLSFSIEPGEIVGLLGPNGAGKTTLIHMLLGLILPTQGRISLFGMPMPEERQAILQRVNFSSAYVQMPMSLTPRQNLKVFARLYGVERPDQRAEALLRRMEIYDMADRRTRALSSGQFSRLSLAKALLNDPQLLLLDEPTASMDPDIAEKTRAILKEIQKERGISMLYTSHNMREVEIMASRVLFMHRGKFVAQGSPKDLIAHFAEPDLEKVFLRLARQ